MIYALLLWLLPAGQSAPADAVGVNDAAVELLARREGTLQQRLLNVVIEDPALRAEIRRVGLEKGCRTMEDSRSETGATYQTMLFPVTVAAIRKLVPAERLARAQFLSFVSAPLIPYGSRVRDEVARNAADTLAAAEAHMRRVFLDRIRREPSGGPEASHVLPRADLAAALGLDGPYDLDKPSHLGLACADLLISPDVRPTITTGPAR
jgi:hypothetical protein